MNSMIVMFQAFIGGYLIYLAIMGKGKAYDDSAIRDECKTAYHKYLRLFCAVLGPLCLANAAVDYVMLANTAPFLRVLSIALYALSTLGVIVLFVMFFKMRRPLK